MTYDEAFARLSRSKFRSRFHLSAADISYIDRVGIDKIRSHATDFVSSRLAPIPGETDGKQTPMRGHPVFVAQHACALCCRGCMNKWYHVPTDCKMADREIEKTVDFLMLWINMEYEKCKNDN